MADFEKIKTEEEEAVELENEIREFMKQMDLIRRVAKNIPSTSYVNFDPLLFMLWRKK